MAAALSFIPRLLPISQAAIYIGVSETKLRALPIKRRVLGGKRLYDRYDLDAYINDLDHEGEGVDGPNPLDDVFGAQG